VWENQNCIIESIRTLGEIEALRKIGHFHLLAIKADLRKQNISAYVKQADFILDNNKMSIIYINRLKRCLKKLKPKKNSS